MARLYGPALQEMKAPAIERVDLRRHERIASRAGDREQQKAAHDAEVLVEVEHVRVALRAFQLPIAVADQRGAQREGAEEERERAGKDAEHYCDADEQLHRD